MSKDTIVSEANRSNENRHVKKKRHKDQRTLIWIFTRHQPTVSLPCRVIMTRIAPREYDFDNLVSSLKYVRDYIAEWIIPGQAKGRADGDKLIRWHYFQEKGEVRQYALNVKIIEEHEYFRYQKIYPILHNQL